MPSVRYGSMPGTTRRYEAIDRSRRCRDFHPQLIQCEELGSNFLRRVRLRSLDGLNPTCKHMEAVGMSCRIRAETPACAPLAAKNTRFLKELPLRCRQRFFPCFDDASRQFQHQP